MISTIEIKIKDVEGKITKAVINYPRNLCSVNGEEFEVSDDFLEDFVDTIYEWQHEYGVSDDEEAEEFFITINSKNDKETFHGKGIFPENYSTIKDFLVDSEE